MRATDPEYSAKVVHDVLKRMAVPSKLEQEVLELKNENERLKRELREQTGVNKSTENKITTRKPKKRKKLF